MAGRSGAGMFSRIVILALLILCGYLYWQVLTLQKQVASRSGKPVDQKSMKSPWDSYKLKLPTVLPSAGGKDISLIASAKTHMLNANAAAHAGNFGEATKESQAADNDLKQAESGASAQTRSAVASLRTGISGLQKRVGAAEKAFQSQ